MMEVTSLLNGRLSASAAPLIRVFWLYCEANACVELWQEKDRRKEKNGQRESSAVDATK